MSADPSDDPPAAPTATVFSERDRTMMLIARANARQSSCRRRKVGAVAINRYGRVLAVARNGQPREYPHCTLHPCPGAVHPSGTGLHLCEAIHAEINLYGFCADIMEIDTIYVTASPCRECIKPLANTTCRRIVFAEEYPHPEAKEFWLRIAGREWVHMPDSE